MMSKKRLTEMSYTKFQELMGDYITRSAQQDDAIPAPTFLELLFDALSQRMQKVVRIEGEVINDELIFLPPKEETSLQVRGNQILLGDWHVVVTLRGRELQPA